MTFNPNVPASGQSLGETQPIIQTNFAKINTAFGANHVALTTDATGKHTYIQMAANSAPTTASSEGAVYINDDASGVAQLFYKGETEGSSYQLTLATNGVDPAIAEFATNSAYQPNHNGGWTFLPGGLILQYGKRTSLATDSNNTITFPRSFPTAVFSVIPQGFTTGTSVNTVLINNITTANFRIYNTSSGTVSTLYWMAIGN